MKDCLRTYSFSLALTLAFAATACTARVGDAENVGTSAAAVSFNFTKVEYSVVGAPGGQTVGGGTEHRGLIVDGTSNTVLLSESDAYGQPHFALKVPGESWVGYDVDTDGSALGFSLSGAGVGVHARSAAGLWSALVRGGSAGRHGSADGARLDDDGLSASVPVNGGTLVAAGHVLLPSTNEPRFTAILVSNAANGTSTFTLYDYGPDSAPRATSLGALPAAAERAASYTPPVGTGKGSFAIASDGSAWATFPYDYRLYLYSLGTLGGAGPLQPSLVATLPVGSSFVPDSLRLGIIAVLIALRSSPTPVLSYQAGSELVQVAFDGGALRETARQSIPTGSSGLIADEGIYYYADAQGVWRGQLGGSLALVQ